MCGRYAYLHAWPDIVELYRLNAPAIARNDVIPRDEVTPAQKAPVVRERNGKREAVTMRWGLIAFWAKGLKIASGMTINARAETIAMAPLVSEAWQARRCLVPASGFYACMRTPNGKQPYLIGFKDGRLFSLGGLWQSGKDRMTGEGIETYTIITTKPNEIVGKIHNRMPVIVDPADFDQWLAAETPPADMLRPFPAAGMTAYPVSRVLEMGSFCG